MRTILLALALVAPASFFATSTATAGATRDSATSLDLLGGWEIQSSCEAKAAGAEVAKAGFSTAGWHKTTVPNTVVGALVDDHTYPDPTYGTNMKNLPGMNYST